jgi:Tol biopolymer transport system component
VFNRITYGRLTRAQRRSLCAVAAAAALAALVLAIVPTAGAAYPGPNGLIAFRAASGDGSSQIFTIDPATLHQVQLTHVNGDAQGAPHWNFDSSMITFEYDPAGGCAQVATMAANGDNLNVLPLAGRDVCEGSPTFSADGTRLFYEGYNGKRLDAIYSMKLDGSDRRLITRCQGNGDSDPEVSPDGKMLAFTCGDPSSPKGSALFVTRTNGSGLRQLTPYSLDVGFHEDWSPDSRRIVFISVRDEGTSAAQINTATINADGSDLQWLTHYPAGGLRAYGNSYSPDGRWIVLRMESGDQSGSFQSALFKMKTDGSDLTQITPYSSFRPRGMCWGSAS